MVAYLRRLASQHANVQLLEDLPPQTPANYEDLTHVNREAQVRFTEFIQNVLERRRLAQNK